MTVMILKDGVFAADSATFRGAFVTATDVRKIFRTPEGHLVGCAGLVSSCDAFKVWAMQGFNESLRPDPFVRTEKDEGCGFGAIVGMRDGRVLEFHDDLEPNDVSDEPWAIEGAAVEFMHALATIGWSAEEIVAHTIKNCVWAAGEVFAMRLDEREVDAVTGEPLDNGVLDLGDVSGNGVWVDKPPSIDTFLRDRGLE